MKNIIQEKKRKEKKRKEKKKIILQYIFKMLIIFILSLIFKTNKKLFSGRIFVSFMYNNEKEMAYIHIWRLYDYVDKFIMLISNRTFSGVPKNISFSEFENNIRPYMNKVDIVSFNNICNKKEYPSINQVWCFENTQRDYAKTYIEEHYNPTENDLLIVVDIDEIFTREGIKYVKNNPPKDFYYIKGSLYFPYYYHKVKDWDRGLVIRYNSNLTTTLSKIRLNINISNIFKYKNNASKPLITHCSYCFNNLEQYKNKFKSFSHQEFNRNPYITNNWIFKSHYCRTIIKGPPGYEEPYEGLKDLIPDDQRLKYLIDPSFMLPLNLTTYTEKDLETLCDRYYNRSHF